MEKTLNNYPVKKKNANFYIGEIGHTFDTSFKEHLAKIKANSNHFNQAGHSIPNVCVKGLWLLFMNTSRDRKDMEFYLIEKLGSRKPG